MATTKTTSVQPAPGTPTINFPLKLQRFYAARGMWADDQPRGWLWTILGRRMWPDSTWFFISVENIHELMRDLAENGRRGIDGHALGQYLRRMREALKKAGESVPPWRPVTPPHLLDDSAISPATAVQRPVPVRAFEPLVAPTRGRAKQAFEKHVFDCVRDICDYQQTSAYSND